MEQSKWTGYANYLVLTDKSKNKLRGNYYNFQDFKTVMSVIERLSNTDSTTYSYSDTIYNRKITSTEARNILTNIDMCKWTTINEKIILVANQLGLRV
tara:strand:+ start:282 stop:575 length:294 start_codon:yes stop_codon:yes gene_type:complete